MTARWTFMVYMAGNNSLSDAANEDLAEMRRVGSSDAVKIAVFIKQAYGSVRRILLGATAKTDQVEVLPEDTDSGSPQIVAAFVRWAVGVAPAERYALILWNHGGGWSPDDLDQLYAPVRAEDAIARRDLANLSRKVGHMFFSSSIRTVLGQRREERMVCIDESTGHSLDTIELDNVLRSAQATCGKRLDLLGMDACLMSTLEVAYQAREHVEALVGSEDTEPAAGWPYDRVLSALQATPAMDGAGLAKIAVHEYVASYKSRPAEWPVTQSAVDANRLEVLASGLDDLVRALLAKLPEAWPVIQRAQVSSVAFEEDLYDLRSFCTALSRASDADIKGAASALANAIANGGCILADGHLGSKVKACGGLTVYFPPPTSPISRYYAKLAFAKRHRWDDFLRAYHQATRDA